MSPSPKPVKIGDRVLGPDEPPFIVAELSANHGGDLDRALKIIDLAAEADADAVKFQAYTANSLTLDMPTDDFCIQAPSPWAGQRLHELYEKAATPYDWLPDLFDRCTQNGLVPFASPFDREAVSLLQKLDAPAYKIASFESVDLDLIAACAETGKPIIISVGLCNPCEVGEALTAAKDAGARDIILLQCNSAYPSPDEDANLITIPAMRDKYNVLVGYSDHTLSATSSIVACGLGACIIEKHFIDQRTPKTADSEFSLTPTELATLVTECRTAWRMLGNERDGPTKSEVPSLAFRRSLYVVSDMAEGQKFTAATIRSVRPAYGLAPKHLNDVLGCHASRAIRAGEALEWSMISDSSKT